MRSVFYWEAAGLSLERGNPYGGLLARALSELGVELIAGHAADLCEHWLLENRRVIDVLHLNWPNYMYTTPDLAESVSRCAELVRHLSRARALGYRIVWTVHNLYPHQSAHPELDRLFRLSLAGLASALIVHCRHARRLVAQHFFREEGVFEIPHGHFIDPYPNVLSRADARQQLGISTESFVYLAFGGVSPYKGLEQLIEAFSGLTEEHLTLLLAAHVHSDYGIDLVERARRADRRVVAHTSRYFPNEAFQVYLNAADVVVFPFREVLTSGSVITALSFGRPVIVPAIGCLPELIDDSMGIIYDPGESDGLERSLKAIQGRDLIACGRAAYRRAESLSWESIARLTLEAYRHGAGPDDGAWRFSQ